MLSADSFWSEPLAPYRSGWISAEPASEAWQRRAYFALRREVFVEEQKLFVDSDRDQHDEHALHLVALAPMAGVASEVVGVVRIYQAPSQVWYGGRLAVVPHYRKVREVGAALIRAAVGAARGLGASRFLATVQSENARYFERHHFRSLQPLMLHGHAHELMEAQLSAFLVPSWLAQLTPRAA